MDVYIYIYQNHDLKTCDHNHGKYILVQLFYHVHQLQAAVLIFQVLVVLVAVLRSLLVLSSQIADCYESYLWIYIHYIFVRFFIIHYGF
jgi:hypothetical protein